MSGGRSLNFPWSPNPNSPLSSCKLRRNLRAYLFRTSQPSSTRPDARPVPPSQIPGPGSKTADTSITAASDLPDAVPLTEAISTIASRGKVFTESSLPPKLPTSFPRWNPAYSEDAPHDPNSYFPMKLIH